MLPVSDEMKNRRIKVIVYIAVCLIPIVLRNTPSFVIRPWLGAIAEALCMVFIMQTSRKSRPAAFAAALLAPALDYALGNMTPSLIAFYMLGYFLTAVIWSGSKKSIVTAGLCGLALFLLRTAGYSAAYIIHKELPACQAVLKVTRNAWFIGGIYIAAAVLFAVGVKISAAKRAAE